MMNQITVNGRPVKVTNQLSCGPGEKPHTYELTYGSYVYEIGGVWWLQQRGQFKQQVQVEVVAHE